MTFTPVFNEPPIMPDRITGTAPATVLLTTWAANDFTAQSGTVTTAKRQAMRLWQLLLGASVSLAVALSGSHWQPQAEALASTIMIIMMTS